MSAHKSDIDSIVANAIAAVNPYEAVKRFVSIKDSVMNVVTPDGTSIQKSYLLDNYAHIRVVGCGKAGAPMSLALEDILGSKITDGVVTIKYGHAGAVPLKRIKLIEGGHPTPDIAGATGAQQAADLLSTAGANDLVIAVVSGGGSSLWPLPAHGITLDEKKETTSLLLGCGAPIHEMNTVRKHLSAIKGGYAARLGAPADMLVLVLSDVVGDDLDVIASGPFVPDSSTFSDAMGIVKKYHIFEKLPSSVQKFLTNGIATASLETPKVQDPCFKSVRHVLCATNALSVAAAGQKARELGYEVVFWDEPLCGEAKDAAKLFAEKLMTMAESHSGKICLIAGGETTVTLGNNPGLGGRNQEFALACAEPFANRPGITIASVGTDGSDGPTDAAGAIVDGTTIQRARDVRLDAHEMLKAHNAYPFFKEIGDLVVTGPTGTNVMDIQVGLIDNRE